MAETEWVLVPREPTVELINSMVMRFDHGAFSPAGQEVLGVPMGPKTEEERLARISMLRTQMRQLHEEVVGLGFYKPPHQEEGELLPGHPVLDLIETLEANPTEAFGASPIIAISPEYAKKAATALRTYLLSQASQIEALRKERDEYRDMADGYGKLDAEFAIAETKLAEAIKALTNVLDHVSDTLGCGRRCIIEAEAEDEAEYSAAIRAARSFLDANGPTCAS